MYRLNFYVPETDLEKVKDACFKSGAGKIGNYQSCCWQTKGVGQFLPMPHANPTIGEIGHKQKVTEYKVEMVLEKHLVSKVIDALVKAHPYEQPAYDLVEILT